MSEFGKRLRDRRKAKGMTLSSLAKAIGCSATYLADVESGRRPAMRRNLAARAGRALGIEGAEMRRFLFDAAFDRTNSADAETLGTHWFTDGMRFALDFVRNSASIEAAVAVVEEQLKEIEEAGDS